MGIHTDFPHLHIDSIGMDSNGVCSPCGTQFRNQTPSIYAIRAVSCLWISPSSHGELLIFLIHKINFSFRLHFSLFRVVIAWVGWPLEKHDCAFCRKINEKNQVPLQWPQSLMPLGSTGNFGVSNLPLWHKGANIKTLMKTVHPVPSGLGKAPPYSQPLEGLPQS